MEGMAAAALGRRPVAASRAAGADAPGASFWKGANLAGRQEASLLEMARESLRNATSWMTAQGALARRLRAGGSDREKVRIEPTPREREAARKLQLLSSSASAREALEKGKLLSLGAQLKGREGSGDSGSGWKTEESRPGKAAGYKGAGGDNAVRTADPPGHYGRA